MFKRLQEELGFDRVLGFHSLRHTCGTELLRRTGNLSYTQVPLSASSVEPARDPEWPPRPNGLASPSRKERARVFGSFAHEPAPTRENPEAVRITDGWDAENIVRVTIPQLVGIAGANRAGQIYANRAIKQRLTDVFAAWDQAGMMHRVLTWDGSYVPRYVRGSRSRLSNHAYGTAFDINARWNRLGARPAYVGDVGTVRELVPIAADHGFFWGGWYRGRRDGMHFEFAGRA